MQMKMLTLLPFHVFAPQDWENQVPNRAIVVHIAVYRDKAATTINIWAINSCYKCKLRLSEGVVYRKMNFQKEHTA